MNLSPTNIVATYIRNLPILSTLPVVTSCETKAPVFLFCTLNYCGPQSLSNGLQQSQILKCCTFVPNQIYIGPSGIYSEIMKPVNNMVTK